MNNAGSITSTPDNANSNAPAALATPTVPTLTPELCQLVLAGLRRFRCDEELGDVADYEAPGKGFGVLSGIEATLAVERAGTVRPFIDLVFAQFEQWDAPVLPASEHAEGPDFAAALGALRHTVYGVLGGVYATLYGVEHGAVLVELAEECEQLLRAAGERADEGNTLRTPEGIRGNQRNGWARAAECLADMTGWLVSAARPLDGPGRNRGYDARSCDEALSAVGNAASHLARWLLENGDAGSADRFVEALRSIPGAAKVA